MTKVLSVIKSGRMRILRVEKSFDYAPGQFVKLTYNGISRFYSLASAPHMPYFEFLIAKVEGGAFTSQLDELEGKDILIEGPFGIKKPLDKIVMIVGGSGLAPAMSIVRAAVKENAKDVWLFISSRSLADNPYLSELLSMPIRIYQTFTREEVPGFKSGRWTIEEIKNIIGDYKSYYYFICGSKSFATTMKLGLEDLPSQKLHVEMW